MQSLIFRNKVDIIELRLNIEKNMPKCELAFLKECVDVIIKATKLLEYSYIYGYF